MGNFTRNMICCLALGSLVPSTAGAELLLRDFSSQPRRLVVCAFDTDMNTRDFVDDYLESIDWHAFSQRDITVTEISEHRSVTHISTGLGPISSDVAFTLAERKSQARNYGCSLTQNEFILFEKSGVEQTHWVETIPGNDLLELIDQSKHQ
ncbi:hypothetical protein [Ponticaulis sp.]|uniref:hypothetical protein n=1 Tax=Ponticaulis sp. TaxID=2020902 RepID=UPI0025EBF365|nr:hypothetical protein [Ponticaulis sp.]